MQDKSLRICAAIFAGDTPLMNARPPVSAAIEPRVFWASLVRWKLSAGDVATGRLGWPAPRLFGDVRDWMNDPDTVKPWASTV
jgi:hypothetical protein